MNTEEYAEYVQRMHDKVLELEWKSIQQLSKLYPMKDPFPIAKGMSKFMLDSLEPGDVVELDNGDEVRLLRVNVHGREFFEGEVNGSIGMARMSSIVGLISKVSSYNEQSAVNAEPKCNCGGAKCQVPHSDWCMIVTGVP